MTPAQTASFLAQFQASRDAIAAWPAWMRPSMREATASFPRLQSSQPMNPDSIPGNFTTDPMHINDGHDYATTPEQMNDLVGPLFRWMHEHGIDTLTIDRNGQTGNITFNGLRA